MNINELVAEINKKGLLRAGASFEELMKKAIEAEKENTELKQQLAAVVAESAALKAAFDKPQAYLSWHAIPPTWEDPLPCGEYLDVHDEAGHKNSDGTDCWPVFAKPEIETPVTDAAIANIQAQGVDMVIAAKKHQREIMHADTFGYGAAQESLRNLINELELFAAQLRQGAEHE